MWVSKKDKCSLDLHLFLTTLFLFSCDIPCLHITLVSSLHSTFPSPSSQIPLHKTTLAMGVFGEKHTSLTREQKRQLIHQADTHKLRPTEVCDWVQKTWGLRIARVTVYSILHKQRASLMAGHKDLYQSMQSTQQGADSKSSSSSTSDHHPSFANAHADTNDSCLDRNKNSGRVNKYRASPVKNKAKGKDGETNKAGTSKRSRSSSVMSDRSISSGPAGTSPLEGAGEGMFISISLISSPVLDEEHQFSPHRKRIQPSVLSVI